MSKKQDKDSGEDKFAEFVSSAIRAPRQGVYEHLLSQFLASAVVVSDPLKRIKIVTEAAMMVPEREREDLAVNYETVDVLNTVCIAFQNRITKKGYWLERQPPFEIVIIPWGFPHTEKNFERYIAPWYHSSVRYHPLVLDEDHLIWHTIWYCLDCRARLGMDGEKPTGKCPKCGKKFYGVFRSEQRYEVVKDPF